MADRLRTSKEIVIEIASRLARKQEDEGVKEKETATKHTRATGQTASIASRPIKELGDAGLEVFLHLLDPELPLPKAVVEPQKVKLHLDKGENKEVSIRINNQGRGYLSGTIELSKRVPGLDISAHRFGLHGKAGKTERQTTVNLRVNTKNMEAGRKYRSSIVINTNGKPDNIVVPLFIQAADRKKRSREVTGHVLKYGLPLALVYWLVVLDQVATIFGFGGILGGLLGDPNPIRFLDVSIYLVLIGTIYLPTALLLSKRRPGRFNWACFAGSLALVFFGLERAVSGGTPDIAWAFGTVVFFALIPLLVSISITRFLYYRSPHLSGILSLVITAAILTLSWSGLALL